MRNGSNYTKAMNKAEIMKFVEETVIQKNILPSFKAGDTITVHYKIKEGKMSKDLDYYLNLNWTYRFEWSDEDNAYIATIAELNGCMTDAQTIEEAARMIKEALKSYIENFLGLGKQIPEPANITGFLAASLKVTLIPDNFPNL